MLPGLHYCQNFQAETNRNWEQELEAFFQQPDLPWHNIGTAADTRRVIHYGYSYNYRTGAAGEPTDAFPPLISDLRDAIKGLVWIVSAQFSTSTESELCSIPDNEPMDQCIVRD
jgi:hypothetical protein